MQKITTCLWFDNNAEEAVAFYTSIFKNSKVLEVSRWGEGGPGEEGAVLTMRFQLDGVEIMALNGGPAFEFSEAISLSVDCQSQTEVDELWEKLVEGGAESECGWLKDKFGLSWQIVPRLLLELLADPDRGKSKRVMEAMLKMKKIETSVLQEAHKG